jgi:hypothetical protein
MQNSIFIFYYIHSEFIFHEIFLLTNGMKPVGKPSEDASKKYADSPKIPGS